MEIILASGSPRRRELLTMIGIKDFTVCPAKGDEVVDERLEHFEVVQELALQKCREVAKGFSKDALIIAADTVVSLEGKLLGKPKDEEDAFNMLSSMSGKFHTVFTGVALIKNGEEKVFYESSKVKFRNLDKNEILGYIATKEPMDKAGSYGAQGLGALFVEGIEGDFFNVMGLPLCRLNQALKEMEINLL